MEKHVIGRKQTLGKKRKRKNICKGQKTNTRNWTPPKIYIQGRKQALEKTGTTYIKGRKQTLETKKYVERAENKHQKKR